MIDVVAISAELLDRYACRALWQKCFHPVGPCCPKCNTSLTGPQIDSWRDGRRVRCHSCNMMFSWRTGTPLDGRSVDECQLVVIASLVYWGLDDSVIARACNLSAATVRRWRERLDLPRGGRA